MDFYKNLVFQKNVFIFVKQNLLSYFSIKKKLVALKGFFSVNQITILMQKRIYILTAKKVLEEKFLTLDKGFLKDLSLRGTGYRCWIQGIYLFFLLGNSHIYRTILNPNVFFFVRKADITLFSFNKEQLLNFYNQLINMKKLDSYKLKGLVDIKKKYVAKTGKKNKGNK